MPAANVAPPFHANGTAAFAAAGRGIFLRLAHVAPDVTPRRYAAIRSFRLQAEDRRDVLRERAGTSDVTPCQYAAMRSFRLQAEEAPRRLAREGASTRWCFHLQVLPPDGGSYGPMSADVDAMAMSQELCYSGSSTSGPSPATPTFSLKTTSARADTRRRRVPATRATGLWFNPWCPR